MGEEQLTAPLDVSAFFVANAPDLKRLEATMKANPDLAKLDASLEQSKGALDLEKANSIPDPNVSLGVVQIPSASDQAFMLGVSLPIPVFNANRGNIQRARSTVSRTELDNRQTALGISTELNRAEQQMENAYLQSQTLQTQIMPSADKAFRLSREGYGLGRFQYIEVLDAQRSLFGVKQQHVAALKEYHIARANAERLAAVHLEEVKNQHAQSAQEQPHD
jgi:cobalt-zinc-cadmium efflux system outer membrane protein